MDDCQDSLSGAALLAGELGYLILNAEAEMFLVVSVSSAVPVCCPGILLGMDVHNRVMCLLVCLVQEVGIGTHLKIVRLTWVSIISCFHAAQPRQSACP